MHITMFSLMLLAATGAAPPPGRDAFAERVRAAYENLKTLSFNVQIQEDLAELNPPNGRKEPAIKRTLDVHVTHAKEGKFRIEVYEKRKPIAAIVSDGKEVTEWDGIEGSWTRYPLPSSEKETTLSSTLRTRILQRNFAAVTWYADPEFPAQGSHFGSTCEMLKHAKTRTIGEKNISGHDCLGFRYEDTQTGPQGQTLTEAYTLFIDKQSHLLIKETQHMEGKFGSMTLTESSRTWLYRDIRPNVKLADDVFVFTPPKDSKFISPDAPRFEQAKPPPSLDGKPAPAFTLPSVDGGLVSLADYKDKKNVLLVFWATWCAPCQQEIPMLCELHKEYGDKGLAVVGISSDASLKAVKMYLKKNTLPYINLHDVKQEAGRAYDARSIPYTLLIDKSGRVVKSWRGWGGTTEELEIRKDVAKLLEE